LREALAAADHDFVLAETTSKLKRVRDRLLSGRKLRGSKRTARRGRRYVTLLAIGFFLSVTTAILFNALVWQKTRHPAPLFARPSMAAHPKEPAIAEVIPAPAPRPQPPPLQAHDKPAEKQPSQKLPAEKLLPEKPLSEKSAAAHPQHPSANVPPPNPHDEISDLIKAPDTPSVRPSAPISTPAPAVPRKTIIAAQRALIKLGFVLTPDGVEGATMRRAIERFERDRGLPVHGKLTPAILKRLRTEAGI
jgi:Putative peptidoglycan binding domain